MRTGANRSVFRQQFASRQANAAVALCMLGRPDAVWPLLRHSPDPAARSYLIHRLGLLGGDPGALVQRALDEENERDVSARRALVLCLGEFGEDRLGKADREALAGRLALLKT